ncbi:MAG: hypothetical protein IPG42_12345 [Betaproteobacteria bacterium]|nr:hypothetical protein [Betaproteobacteria bacterium]
MPYLLNLLKAACLAALVCSVAHAGLIVGTRAIGNSGVGATDATGVVVNTDGIGHVLVVPYFNAQGGNVSILSVVNTDIINGKAVKVRYRGASNADNLLNLTVFLAPGMSGMPLFPKMLSLVLRSFLQTSQAVRCPA